MTRSTTVRAVVSASLVLATLTVNGDIIHWDGNGAIPPSGLFSEPLNWDPNSVPSENDDARFDITGGSTYTVTFTTNPTNTHCRVASREYRYSHRQRARIPSIYGHGLFPGDGQHANHR